MVKKVIILGGGPAGLSCAWKLVSENVQVEVIEKEDTVGGLCRTIHKKINGEDYFFDLGGHRFITKDMELYKELEELMGEELVVMPRKSVIRLQGKFFSYPLQITDALKKMNIFVSIKSGIDFVFAKIFLHFKKDVTFEDWIVKRFGRKLYNIYFGVYTEKLWGIPCNQLSADWAAQRIPALTLWKVLVAALGKKKEMPKTFAENFLFPKKGIGRICDRMEEEILKHKGKVITGAKVEKLVMGDKKITEVHYIKDGKEYKTSGDYVVSTIPLPEFIQNVTPSPDEKVMSLAKSMKFRGIKFLFLAINKNRISDNTWIYIPEKEYIFFRIQEMRNWSPYTVPEGKTGITLEIACNENDEIWNASDEFIFNKCIKDIEKLGLFKRNDVINYFTYKVKHAYPVYYLDYHERVRVLYTYISQIKDFIAIGRQGLFRYNNMDHSIKMGMLAAKHILEGYPKQKVLEIATENIIFDWQDPGYFDGEVKL